MSIRSKLNVIGVLAVALSSFACAEDPSATDEAEQGATRQHRFGWVRIGDCATSIGVSPDDTLWLVGCDAAADGDIWYTRLDGDVFAQSRVWIQTNGRAQRVSVDDGGEPQATTSSGGQYVATITRTNGNPPAAPTGEWAVWISDGATLFNHLESFLVFQTQNDVGVAPWQHQFYKITFAPDGSLNGTVSYKTVADSTWRDTGIKARSMALFTPGAGPSAFKELWTLDSNGGLKTYDPSLNNGGLVRPTPPSSIVGLTDHYALTAAGVYHWNDSRGDWDFYLDRTTPTGQVTEIAHAGAVTVKLANGTSATFESGVWAIDDSGTIYKAGDETVIF